MAGTAAVSGHGLLLGYSGYVDAEVAAGALVYPFDLRVPTGKGYHLVYRKERLVDPRVRAFREWVKSEAAGDRKSVVWGKSVAVRVKLGGRRVIRKQRYKKHQQKKD